MSAAFLPSSHITDFLWQAMTFGLTYLTRSHSVIQRITWGQISITNTLVIDTFDWSRVHFNSLWIIGRELPACIEPDSLIILSTTVTDYAKFQVNNCAPDIQQVMQAVGDDIT